MHFRLKIIATLCCLLLASQFGFGATKKRKATPPPAPPPVQEAQPSPPQPPPTPEQLPAVAPRVSMDDGLLTISAENSTLGDILSAVRKQTGASVDVPSSFSGERVATRLGPGNPRDVIQQLFAGSKFDYIIVGSPQDPTAIQRIIVSARGAGGTAMANNQQMNRQNQNYQPAADASDADEEPQPEPTPAEPAQAEQQPQVTPPTGAQPYSNQPKTPEQLLQELQQMQQQQGQRPPRTDGPKSPQPQPQ